MEEPTRPTPGRRDYDGGGAMVVPLREYLEQQIKTSHDEIAADVRHVRADVADVRANVGEVRVSVDSLKVSIDALERADNAQRVSLRTLAVIWGGLLTFLGVATAIAALLLQTLGG